MTVHFTKMVTIKQCMLA